MCFEKSKINRKLTNMAIVVNNNKSLKTNRRLQKITIIVNNNKSLRLTEG